jgi:hypothetical protein
MLAVVVEELIMMEADLLVLVDLVVEEQVVKAQHLVMVQA